MKKNIRRILIMLVITIMLAFSTVTTCATTSDYQLAKQWVKNHDGKYTITKVVTISKGGVKGKVKGTKYTVKYPKKVKKGKKVVCYMIEKKGDVCAMVCCGKIK